MSAARYLREAARERVARDLARRRQSEGGLPQLTGDDLRLLGVSERAAGVETPEMRERYSESGALWHQSALARQRAQALREEAQRIRVEQGRVSH